MDFHLLTQRFSSLVKNTPLLISLLAVLAIFYDFGFDESVNYQKQLNGLYITSLLLGIIWTIGSYLKKTHRSNLKIILFDVLSILFFIIVLFKEIESEEASRAWLYLAVFLAFIRKFSTININLRKTFINPAQLFIASFLCIILFGAFLLSLPNAAVEKTSFIDALFTSTSAVCVTGLVIADTGTYFTLFGQSVILVLIQIGGLGIMTFASYFSYFFSAGGTSYHNHLMINDMSNSNKLGEVFSMLKNIILITLSIELVGAFLIFGFVEQEGMGSFFHQVFFAVFHSISAFCNAGFSILPESLYTEAFRFNYGLHSVLMLLFIVGGLGFPIVFNLFKYLKYSLKKRALPYFFKENNVRVAKPWVLNLNSRITLITTFTLLICGSIIFFIFEYSNSLAEHEGIGKIIVTFFSAATPRTAGFHIVDTSSLRFSTLMLIFLLMWVGASPGSTGGGIKTSTFAIATLNFWSLARGKNRIEIFRREIADISVRRAFAIISLSLVIIGTGVFAIAYLDSEKDLLGIAFECFSAYSTVGLSVGITDQLSNGSKIVLILMMFIGRVSMLSILIAIFRKEKFKNYRYSQEEILIN